MLRRGEAADRLVHPHIIEGGEPLRFTHPLIATAVHADLPAFARARGHRHLWPINTRKATSAAAQTP
jgi:hypothetical protein